MFMTHLSNMTKYEWHMFLSEFFQLVGKKTMNQKEYFLKYWTILHWTLLKNSKLPTNISLKAIFNNWQRQICVMLDQKTKAFWKLKVMAFIVLPQDTPKQMLGKPWQLCMALNSVRQLSADLKTCSSVLKMHAN